MKTLGKLLMIFFSMLAMLVLAALGVVMLALIVRFKLVFAIFAVFLFFVWLAADKTGVEINTDIGVKKGRYRYVTADGQVMYFDEEDLEKEEG